MTPRKQFHCDVRKIKWLLTIIVGLLISYAAFGYKLVDRVSALEVNEQQIEQRINRSEQRKEEVLRRLEGKIDRLEGKIDRIIEREINRDH